MQAALLDVIGIPEVAQLMGVNQSLVNRWVRRGDLPARRVGRVFVIRRVDAERLKQRRESQKCGV